MNTEPVEITQSEPLKSQERLKMAAQILSGLLASGHYTFVSEDDDFTPGVKTCDAGKDWREDGQERRHIRMAVDTAESLLEDLERRFTGGQIPNRPESVI